MQKKIDTDKVRAGTTPHIVRYVLMISLILVIAGMAIVYLRAATF